MGIHVAATYLIEIRHPLALTPSIDRAPTPAGHFITPLPHTFPRLLFPSSLFSPFLVNFSFSGDDLRFQSLHSPPNPCSPQTSFRFSSFPTSLHHESWIVSANYHRCFTFCSTSRKIVLQFVSCFILIFLNQTPLDPMYSSWCGGEFSCLWSASFFFFFLILLWCMACEICFGRYAGSCFWLIIFADLDQFP